MRDACAVHGSKAALFKAKMNIKRGFVFIGILERIDETIEALEQKLPQFFKGMAKLKGKMQSA